MDEKKEIKNIRILFLYIILALSIILIVSLILIINHNNKKYQELEKTLNNDVRLKIFDCRRINRDDIIIGIEDTSLIQKINLPLKYNQSYLIANPHICNTKNSSNTPCTPFFIETYNETALWMIENAACDLYYVNLSSLINATN